MALFIDGGVASIRDLERYESTIVDLAVTEGIDLDVKLDLAHEEVGVELSALLRRLSGASGPRVEQVIVSTALRQWVRLHALSLTYRDAYHSQANDRYGSKWKEYAGLTGEAKERVTEIGIGYVLFPLRRPGPPVWSMRSGPGVGGTYFVQTTWVNSSGQESAASEMVAVNATTDSLIRIQTGPAPAGVHLWNLYVGRDETTARQNATPMDVAQSRDIGGAEPVSGPAPGEGQAADQVLAFSASYFRG